MTMIAKRELERAYGVVPVVRTPYRDTMPSDLLEPEPEQYAGEPWGLWAMLGLVSAAWGAFLIWKALQMAGKM